LRHSALPRSRGNANDDTSPHPRVELGGGAQSAFVHEMAEIDPGIADFLKVLNTLPVVAPDSVPITRRRALFAQFAGGHSGEGVACRRVEDVTVAMRDGVRRQVRVYSPFVAPVAALDGPTATAGAGAAPVAHTPAAAFLYLHGGGWHAGSLSTHDALCRRLAVASGCVIASLDYRMAPEYPAPTAVADCADAFDWLTSAATAAALHIDPARVGVAGDSAGSNIVAGGLRGESNQCRLRPTVGCAVALLLNTPRLPPPPPFCVPCGISAQRCLPLLPSATRHPAVAPLCRTGRPRHDATLCITANGTPRPPPPPPPPPPPHRRLVSCEQRSQWRAQPSWQGWRMRTPWRRWWGAAPTGPSACQQPCG
jgi:hypothetical protein